MFVNDLLSEARKRLITIRTEALLTDAAKTLSGQHAELVVVCDADGKAVGVITKADIVRRITHCQGAACRAAAAAAMTQDVIFCRPDDHVSDIWSKMKQHGLRHIPIVDGQSRPLGIINAREVLQALLINAANEAELLRDYVLSVGYHPCCRLCSSSTASIKVECAQAPPARISAATQIASIWFHCTSGVCAPLRSTPTISASLHALWTGNRCCNKP